MNTLIVISVLATLVVSSLASDCILTSNCRCQLGASSFIDLNKITDRLNVSRLLVEKFTLQLCNKFSMKQCNNVYGCAEIGLLYHPLGNSSQFVSSSIIKFQGSERSAIVKLVCNPNIKEQLKYVKEVKGTYNFELTSKYACIQTLAPNTTTVKTTTTTPKSTSTTTKTTTTTKSTPTTTKTTTTPKTNSTTTTTKATTKTSTTTSKTSSTTAKSTTPKSSSTTQKLSSTTSKGRSSTVSTITFGTSLLAVILFRKQQ